MQKGFKWTPAVAVKRQDIIISSKAREMGSIGFKPSYLSEPRENMDFIMTNEYMRIWFKERGKYEKNTYSKEQIIKEESKIKRRFVQRMMTYKKPTKNEFIDEKCRKKSNKETKEEQIDYSKYKYKPACPKQKEKHGSSAPKEPKAAAAGGSQGPVSRTPSKKGKLNETGGYADNNRSPPVIFCPVNQNCCSTCQ